MSLTQYIESYKRIFLFCIIKLSPYMVFTNMLGIHGLLDIRPTLVFKVKSKKDRIFKELVGSSDGSVWIGFDSYPGGWQIDNSHCVTVWSSPFTGLTANTWNIHYHSVALSSFENGCPWTPADTLWFHFGPVVTFHVFGNIYCFWFNAVWASKCGLIWFVYMDCLDHFIIPGQTNQKYERIPPSLLWSSSIYSVLWKRKVFFARFCIVLVVCFRWNKYIRFIEQTGTILFGNGHSAIAV